MIKIKMVEGAKIGIHDMNNDVDRRKIVILWKTIEIASGFFFFPFKNDLSFTVIMNQFSHCGHTSFWLAVRDSIAINCMLKSLIRYKISISEKKETSDTAFQGDNCTSQVVKKKMIYK